MEIKEFNKNLIGRIVTVDYNYPLLHSFTEICKVLREYPIANEVNSVYTLTEGIVVLKLKNKVEFTCLFLLERITLLEDTDDKLVEALYG